MARVLVVDDDRSLLRALRVGLAARGHHVDVAQSGKEGLSRLALDSPDVVVLDLGLPDIDGLDVCRRLRAWSDAPVIVLSATASEDRKVAALDGGADDYVTKPFGMAELDARIRAALRHHRPREEAGPTVVEAGPLHLDLVHHEAALDGRAVALTAREFDLLAFLTRHAGRVCTHQMILEAVWGPGFSDEHQYLRVYVYRLRRKLDDPRGALLRSIPGVGYALAAG